MCGKHDPAVLLHPSNSRKLKKMDKVSKHLFCLPLLIKMSFLARDGPLWPAVTSLATTPKSLHSTALSPGACNNCLNICPTGQWPLTGHRNTKSCLTGFLLPAKRDSVCWGHLRCAVLSYSKKHKIQYDAEQRRKGLFSEFGWPNSVPALPFASCVALRWLHFFNLLCHRQTLSSCSWSVCNKRVDF